MSSGYAPIDCMTIYTITLSRHEIWVVLQASIIRALNLSCFSVYVPLVMFAMFSVYATGGGAVTPKRVFTILSLLTVLRVYSVHLFTLGVLLLSEAVVGLKRIQVCTLSRSLVLSI